MPGNLRASDEYWVSSVFQVGRKTMTVASSPSSGHKRTTSSVMTGCSSGSALTSSNCCSSFETPAAPDPMFSRIRSLAAAAPPPRADAILAFTSSRYFSRMSKKLADCERDTNCISSSPRAPLGDEAK